MRRLMLLVGCTGLLFNLSAQVGEITELSKWFVPNNVDIRSIGMGKTEVAGKSGSNAIFSNPSLLALQENGSIKLGTKLHFGFIKDEYFDKYDETNKTESNFSYKPSFKFTSISVALPFHFTLQSLPLSVAFGTGYQNAIDLSFTKYEHHEANQSEAEQKTKYKGGLNTISPGFSIGILDRFSAGLSFNIGFSKLRYNSTTETTSGTLENETEATAVGPGSSFYPTFGFAAKPLENLTLGMSITPSYEWEWDEIEYEVEKNEYDIEGGEFNIPLKFSFGLEFQISPKFSFAIEYQTRPYESYELNADQYSSSEGDLTDLQNHIDSMDLKNGHVLHAGVEIIAGTVPFRFGFFLEPYPYTDQEIKNGNVRMDEKPNYMLGGTFGFGLPIGETVLIDVATQYGFIKTINVEAEPSNFILKKYDHIEHHLRADLGIKIDLPAISFKKAIEEKATPSSNNVNQNYYSTPTPNSSNSPQPTYQPEQNNTQSDNLYNTPPTDYQTPSYDSTPSEYQDSGY